MNGNIHVPEKEKQIWEEAEVLAKALGISRSKLIMDFLKKATEDEKAKVLIADQSRTIRSGARAFLSSVLGRSEDSEGAPDPTDERRVGV